ncbi:MAG: hypothetical protein IRY99_18380 [Isosphaeraceae bacterium]|nr:hypothetical protein [Isosphaeraceae bacterium]
MPADSSRVILSQETAPGASASSTLVHHRDFPEIRAHGQSPADAAVQLMNQLTRALDSALTPWRREAIQQAITDVKAFAEQRD